MLEADAQTDDMLMSAARESAARAIAERDKLREAALPGAGCADVSRDYGANAQAAQGRSHRRTEGGTMTTRTELIAELRQYHEFDFSQEIKRKAADMLEADEHSSLTIEVLRAERNHARAQRDNAIKLLSSIHMLLYPAPFNMADGNTMVFRPKNPDPHVVLQELSDRIRAIPDDMMEADTKLREAARLALDALEHVQWKNWRTDKAITALTEALK
jgi:hypothetical protein